MAAKNTNSSNQSRKRNVVRVSELTLLQLVEAIVERMENSRMDSEVLQVLSPVFEELGARLEITPNQAMWLGLLINMSDDHRIQAGDLARFLDCRSIKVMTHWDEIESLAKKGYIRINSSEMDRSSVMVPAEVMHAFRKNIRYEAPCYANISIEQWLDRLCNLICARDTGNMSFDLLVEQLEDLKNGNPQLALVKNLQSYKLETNDELILLRTLNNYVQDNDEQIGLSDIVDILAERWAARQHARAISRNQHDLQKMGLIELCNEDGRANTSIWHLTDKAKDALLSEFEITAATAENTNGLLISDKLPPKTLYFCADLAKNVNRLRSLLSKERFGTVQDNLEKRGLRRGFACIFYGSPGTGKTETVYQIARETGRNIMLVDVPGLRSKWVGDTEKNIKAVFDRYRKLVSNSSVAPILLFNEADAVLCKRSDNAVTGVDKMENAMQNIILQEMENLNGIMIATTNLTDNLDKAFERRFLYKMEFVKPTPAERKNIWRSMLPELGEEDALTLAGKYDFSGGQIENIARKYIVDLILNGEEQLSMKTIYEACSTELLRGKTNQHIGFE